ncbi:MAG TPA: tetratricopeptide repeat protein [Actinocrinis sp.]
MESSEHGQPVDGAVLSTVSGTAGNVVQVRDVQGGIHLHAAPAPVLPVLRQLPADTALFTGRDDELDRLLALVERAGSGGSPGTVVISAIDGMGGIGKSALAIRAAHRLAEHFPDGQLYLDLYGFVQGIARRDPGDALATLLSSLGVPPGQIPGDVDARAALYRDRLAGTRTLILLDSAADEAQVRPLLPASATCLVLITSRRRLKALDDALPLSLDVLAPEQAVALLRKAARLDGHPRDEPLLAQAAELCGRLPLALLIAGALLRTGGEAWDLPALIDRLAARRPGCELAGYTDDTRSLPAVFDVSYRALPEDRQLLFRRLGLLPGPQVDAYAAAALLETGSEDAGRLLQQLADHSLLIGLAPGRYRLHDLIRAHARSLATMLDPAYEREAAQDRLLHYYAHTAQSASLPISRLPRCAPDGPAPAHAPDLADPQAAQAWLRTEFPNLQAAHTHASTHADALEDHAIALAAGLAEILSTDGPFTRALDIHEAAADAAARRHRPAAQAIALTDLGLMRYQTGDLSGAVEAYTEALGISREIGHRLGEANTLTNLGRVWYLTESVPGAADAFARAVEIYREIGSRLGEAYALTSLGLVRHLTEVDPGADDAIKHAVEIFRRHGHRLGEINALNDLGHVRILTGDLPGAAGAFARALEISRERGYRIGETNALNELGRVRYATGNLSGAAEVLTRALGISLRIGYPRGKANALNYLGRVRWRTGNLQGAAEVLAQALETSRRLGYRLGEANALSYLGRVRCLIGEPEQAAEAHERAVEIFGRLGNRVKEAGAMTHYAATLAATGDRPRALALYQRALAVDRELNVPIDEAECLEGIADHYLATDDPAQGIKHLQQALEIYQRVGMHANVERVTARLAGLAAQ